MSKQTVERCHRKELVVDVQMCTLNVFTTISITLTYSEIYNMMISTDK